MDVLDSGKKSQFHCALGGLCCHVYNAHEVWKICLKQALSSPVHFLMDVFLSRFLVIKILFCFPKPRLYGGNILPSNHHFQAKESCLRCYPLIAHTYLYTEILNLHPPKIKAMQIMKSIPIQTATCIRVSMFLLYFL